MNDGSKTTERIYVWIAEDLDGVEGVISYPFNGSPMPLLASDLNLVQQFTPLARQAANARGATAHLVIFERGETIDAVQGGDQ